MCCNSDILEYINISIYNEYHMRTMFCQFTSQLPGPYRNNQLRSIVSPYAYSALSKKEG